MSKAIIFAKSLLSNWIGFGVNMLVAFFLTPFLVHSLGNVAYGVWVLLMSLTGYLGLIEMGVTVSAGRYINYHIGRGEEKELNKVVNTSLAFFTAISVLIVGVSVILGQFCSHIFTKIPGLLTHQAGLVLFLMSINILLGLYSSMFSLLLTSKDRFDLKNISEIIVLGVRTAAIVWVLTSGYGLVSLAIVTVGASMLGCLIQYMLARWKGTLICYGIQYLNRDTFKRIFNFGAWAFVNNVSSIIISSTDAIVIGALIGSKAITFYMIGFMLVDYALKFLISVVGVMIPEITKVAGRKDFATLQKFMIDGSRIATFFAVPLFVGLIVFGRDFMVLWMGAEYYKSGWIVLILAISRFGHLANQSAGACLWGLGHVKTISKVSIAAAVCNLCLSIFFVMVMKWGIYGVALGTLLPMLAQDMVFMPIFACQKTRMKLTTYLRLTYLRWFVASIMFVCLCLGIHALVPTVGWSSFWLKVFVLGLLYVPIGLLVILGKDQTIKISQKTISILFRRRALRTTTTL